MKKRFWLTISLIAVIALLVAACAPAEAPAMEEEAMEEEAMEEEEAMQEEEAMEEEEAMMEEGAIDCMGAAEGDTLSVFYQWTGAEEERINEVFQPLVDACGIEITAEASRDAAVLDTRVQSTPPDILFWPSTSPLGLYSDMLVPLDTVGGVAENYADYWIDLGSVDGNWYGIAVKADPKSMVWYSPAQFEVYGYAVPTTFEELNTLVETMVADGLTPWSTGFASEGSDGWAGSDFIQEIMLVQQGPEYVLDLLNGDILYDDAGVAAAYEVYQPWASQEQYTVGGATGTVNTEFLESIYLVFQPEPEAMMVKIAGFAGGEITTEFPDLEYGTDFDFFPFPGGQGLQGGYDLVFAFNDSPAVQAMIHFLTTEPGAMAWVEAQFDASPNMLTAGAYEDPELAKKSDMLLNTSGFTPDLGDTLGNPFQQAEWAAIVNVVQGADIQSEIADAAEAQQETLAE